MKISAVTLFLAGSALCSAVTIADAQTVQCDPTVFTKPDIDTLNASDFVSLAATSLSSKSTKDNNNTEVGVTLPIYGYPVNFSDKNAQSSSADYLEKMGYNFERNTLINIVKSRMSTVGASMYKDCLRAQHIEVHVPSSAFSYANRVFVATIRWTPDDQTSVEPLHVALTNAIFVRTNKDDFQMDLQARHAIQLRIKKSGAPNQIATIDVSVGGDIYDTLQIPILARPPRVRTVSLQGHAAPAEVLHGNDYAWCDTYATVYSSSSNTNPHYCRLCVEANDNQILLTNADDITYDVSRPSEGGYSELSAPNTKEVCVNYHSAPSSNGEVNRFVKGTLKVRALEILPR